MPYHWDFDARHMPQHRDRYASNDLPLDQAPHTWISGFPAPDAFTSYSAFDTPINDLAEDTALADVLTTETQARWAEMPQSSAEELHYSWLPDTKVVGAVRFGDGNYLGPRNAHGLGTSSSAIGNLHGTCPECVAVLVTYGGDDREAALNWVMEQPWIDAISNSYGFSLIERDRVYNGGNAEAQRAASERGQTIFFSSGNGISNTFTVPNSTYFSSQEGPDWTITVGAISSAAEGNYYGGWFDGHGSYSGSGKPADVAGIGDSYPTSYNATDVDGTGTSGFSGTSNATPQIAGTYARALWVARRAMAGPSRAQDGGVIARGAASCAPVRPRCEVGDGVLTADELRTRFLHGAVHTPEGTTSYTATPNLPPVGEDEFMNEGHGSYFGRESGDIAPYLRELRRVTDPLLGRAPTVRRPRGERAWMIVDSYCRQHLWGAWDGGYYDANVTHVPNPHAAYPIRTLIRSTCPSFETTPEL